MYDHKKVYEMQEILYETYPNIYHNGDLIIEPWSNLNNLWRGNWRIVGVGRTTRAYHGSIISTLFLEKETGT